MPSGTIDDQQDFVRYASTHPTRWKEVIKSLRHLHHRGAWKKGME